MSTKVLIAPTIDAVTTGKPYITAAFDNMVGLIANGLTGTEEIIIQAENPIDPTGWQNVSTLNVDSPAKTIYLDAFTYRLVKPVTANPVGVAIAQDKGSAK